MTWFYYTQFFVSILIKTTINNLHQGLCNGNSYSVNIVISKRDRKLFLHQTRVIAINLTGWLVSLMVDTVIIWDNKLNNNRTYAQALHERESECQKAPTYSVLKVDLRKSWLYWKTFSAPNSVIAINTCLNSLLRWLYSNYNRTYEGKLRKPGFS